MLEVFGAIFIIIIGSLGHFLYDWTNKNKLVGYFAAVNESTWEHIKLVIAPSFLWLIIEYHFYYANSNLFLARFLGLLVMMIFIPVLFYGYVHITKKNNFFVDISIFILAVILGQYIFRIIIQINYNNMWLRHLGILGLIIIFLFYLTRTYVPIKNFLFKDPITNKYGINRRNRR